MDDLPFSNMKGTIAVDRLSDEKRQALVEIMRLVVTGKAPMKVTIEMAGHSVELEGHLTEQRWEFPDQMLVDFVANNDGRPRAALKGEATP